MFFIWSAYISFTLRIALSLLWSSLLWFSIRDVCSTCCQHHSLIRCQRHMEVCYCVGVLLIELATIKETAFIGAYIDVSLCWVFVYSCFAMAVLALKSSLWRPRILEIISMKKVCLMYCKHSCSWYMLFQLINKLISQSTYL